MIVRRYQKGDIERFRLQQAQRGLNQYYANMDDTSDNNDVIVGEQDGEIMIMSGIIPQWEGRAMAWALVSCNAGKCFRSIHKAVLNFLIQSNVRRIEATVDVSFKPGHRWMKMLGFEPEGYMKAYLPDGNDCILYARVRK